MVAGGPMSWNSMDRDHNGSLGTMSGNERLVNYAK